MDFRWQCGCVGGTVVVAVCVAVELVVRCGGAALDCLTTHAELYPKVALLRYQLRPYFSSVGAICYVN